ncbi:50S ribosomal protein L22 [Parcubacteria bacterium DG_74_3]|nr:MAG: 50S ribosomal protein L22 [Parcubacteria bacterium DG_74_3]
MPVKVKLRYLRIAPRKVRLAADLIRGKPVEKAQTILSFTRKKATKPLLKLLKSAIASATHNFQLEEPNLYISKILVDEGPTLKRWRARARGQAFEIQKRTSHVTIILDELSKKPKKIKEQRIEKKKVGEAEKEIKEKEAKIEKPKFKPELIGKKPKIEKGIKRIFRRKAFG